MGMPTGLQFSITAIGSMVMQSANNGLGSTYVSAFTAAMKIKQFTMCPFDAIATSASVFCSQNLGAGQSDRIKKGLRCGITVGVGYGIAAGILLIFAGRTLSMLFVGKSAVAVLDASAKYLRCMGFFYWSLGILNVARMVTQGLGYSGRAVFSGVTEMIAQNSCLSWICRNFWLHSHLLRRPDCLDHSNLLYFSDMPVVHPKVYKNACIYSSSSK